MAGSLVLCFDFNWINAGRPYAADVWDYDVYSEIGNYAKPVLLMHGDRDGIVPISYAEHAAEVYPDVDYYVIDDGGHGFYGNSLGHAKYEETRIRASKAPCFWAF